MPHKDKQRDGRQGFLFHQSNGIIDHQIKDLVAETDVAEDDAQDDKSEGNGKTDKNAKQKRYQQNYA